jgi:hypothetical protein
MGKIGSRPKKYKPTGKMIKEIKKMAPGKKIGGQMVRPMSASQPYGILSSLTKLISPAAKTTAKTAAKTTARRSALVPANLARRSALVPANSGRAPSSVAAATPTSARTSEYLPSYSARRASAAAPPYSAPTSTVAPQYFPQNSARRNALVPQNIVAPKEPALQSALVPTVATAPKPPGTFSNRISTAAPLAPAVTAPLAPKTIVPKPTPYPASPVPTTPFPNPATAAAATAPPNPIPSFTNSKNFIDKAQKYIAPIATAAGLASSVGNILGLDAKFKKQTGPDVQSNATVKPQPNLNPARGQDGVGYNNSRGGNVRKNVNITNNYYGGGRRGGGGMRRGGGRTEGNYVQQGPPQDMGGVYNSNSRLYSTAPPPDANLVRLW